MHAVLGFGHKDLLLSASCTVASSALCLRALLALGLVAVTVQHGPLSVCTADSVIWLTVSVQGLVGFCYPRTVCLHVAFV